MTDELQVQRLTESSLATIYGCCGIFDMCADEDLMSLHFQGADKFLDWLGWERTDICVVKKEFISYMRPDQRGTSSGVTTDPCADPYGVEWGKCDFTLEDFARLRRHGPVRDVTMNDVRYCERQPRYRLDGTPVTDDREYDMRVITEVLLQDLRRLVITGTATTGSAAGLEALVATGYTDSNGQRCKNMDSTVINWNHNGLGTSAGATWNGSLIGAGYNLVDVLLSAFRKIRQRIMWSPVLGAQPLRLGDVVLVMPTELIRCLLDHYTCWRVCDGSQYNETNINTYEARTFRNNLNGGLFSDGRIYLDGFEIPIIGYDWELHKGPMSYDMYMLTGQVGNVKTLHGQYNDMSDVPVRFSEADYFSTDGGRLLGWIRRDHTCVEQNLEMRPRLLSWAPWTNVRIQNVRCDQPGDPISPDPTSSFYPESSFFPAECP